jgi:glycosyltransferase involved in cell wall biosynthesis
MMQTPPERPIGKTPLKHKTTETEVSIVIPAYNEEKRLPRTFERIRDYLRVRPTNAGVAAHGSIITEIIVVDDGSQDNTAEVVASWRAALPGLRLVSNDTNRGKGYSVRHGMLEATGRIALLTDADLSAPIEEMEKLLEALDSADIAIGSRAMDRALIETRQSRLRELAGIIFNALVRVITGVNFRDTQCGFKAFVLARARIIFEKQRIEGFGFDPEILFLAKQYGLRGIELPVRWAHDPATKVHVVRDSFKMMLDLFLIRWNWLIGRYRIERSRLPLLPRGTHRTAVDQAD